MSVPAIHSGAIVRVSIVLVYGLVVFFVADRLGRPAPERPAIMATETAAPTRQSTELQVNLSASRPVEKWSVRIDRTPINATSLSPHDWSAAINLVPLPDQRLVIDVTPARSPDESPLAVRLTIASGDKAWVQTLWAPGDLVEVIALDAIRKEWESAP